MNRISLECSSKIGLAAASSCAWSVSVGLHDTDEEEDVLKERGKDGVEAKPALCVIFMLALAK